MLQILIINDGIGRLTEHSIKISIIKKQSYYGENKRHIFNSNTLLAVFNNDALWLWKGIDVPLSLDVVIRCIQLYLNNQDPSSYWEQLDTDSIIKIETVLAPLKPIKNFHIIREGEETREFCNMMGLSRRFGKHPPFEVSTEYGEGYKEISKKLDSKWIREIKPLAGKISVNLKQKHYGHLYAECVWDDQSLIRKDMRQNGTSRCTYDKNRIPVHFYFPFFQDGLTININIHQSFIAIIWKYQDRKFVCIGNKGIKYFDEHEVDSELVRHSTEIELDINQNVYEKDLSPKIYASRYVSK